MRRCEEDVKIRRCEDVKMMRRCEDEKMRRCDDRPPLVEERCAQTLWGQTKNNKTNKNNKK